MVSPGYWMNGQTLDNICLIRELGYSMLYMNISVSPENAQKQSKKSKKY